MNKFTIISILLLILGILFFGIAGYSYWTMIDLHKTFGYYGLEEKDYLLSEDVANTFADFKYGIVTFLVWGVIAWIAGIIFFFKRKK